MKIINEIDLYMKAADYVISKYNLSTQHINPDISESLEILNSMNQLLLDDYCVETVLPYRDESMTKYYIELIVQSMDSFVFRSNTLIGKDKKNKFLLKESIKAAEEVYQRLGEEITSTEKSLNLLDTYKSTVLQKVSSLLKEDTSFETEVEYTSDNLIKDIEKQREMFKVKLRTYTHSRKQVLGRLDILDNLKDKED